jgi:rubredoxin-NAD+ reductase
MDKQLECMICNWIYDEEKGDPDSGLKPKTSWADIPDDWACPDCGATKEDFDIVEGT